MVGRCRRIARESGWRVLLSFELTVQRVVLGRERRCGRFSILFCAPQPDLFLMQCVPLLELLNEPAGLDGWADCYFRRVGGVGSGFVFLYHGLDAAPHVAASADKILLRIVHFVLVQLQLGFGKVELIIQCILLRSIGRGLRSRESCDFRLLPSQGILRFLQPRLDLFGLCAQHRWMTRRIKDRRSEREIHFLVSKLQRFLSKSKFRRAGRHLR